MSKNEMVSFPRELSDDLAELIATRARVCGGGAYEIWEAICEGFGQPAEQHQGEPAALAIPDECPHIIVFDDADRGNEHFCGSGARSAALRRYEQISQSWNAHLFVRVARNSRDDRYPCATATDSAEPTAAIKTLQGLGYAYHGAELWKPPLGKKPDFDLIDALRAQLAERDALLRRALGAMAEVGRQDHLIDYTMVCVVKREIDAALSASAEPELKP